MINSLLIQRIWTGSSFGVACLRWFLRNKSCRRNFFETFPKCFMHVFYQALFRKKIIKVIDHRAYLRDVMGQSYPIYACARANQAPYSSVHVTFCGSSMYSILKLYLGKKTWHVESIEHNNISTYNCCFCGHILRPRVPVLRTLLSVFFFRPMIFSVKISLN